MSKLFIDDTFVIIILGLALITVIALWQFQESPEEAYERGYEDARIPAFSLGYMHAVYEITEGFGQEWTCTVNLFEALELDMKRCFDDSLVDKFIISARPLPDSTHTMPVLERLPIAMPDTGGVR